MKNSLVQKNTICAQLLAVALSAAMSFCLAEETKVDYVSLNGGTSEGMLEDKYKKVTSTFSDGICELIREGAYAISATTVDFEGKSGVLKVVSEVKPAPDLWNGPSLTITGDVAESASRKLSDLKKVKVEYYYSGIELVGQKMRMVVILDGGLKYNVESTEPIQAGEWAVAEFDFSSQIREDSDNYKQNKNAALITTRLYFYSTMMDGGAECAFMKNYNFPQGDMFFFGCFFYSPYVVRAVFDMAGAEAIADIAPDSEGKVVLPAPEREGYQFIGWGNGNSVYEGGVEVTIEDYEKYYAIWKNLTPRRGMEKISSDTYALDILEANGSTWGLVTDIYRSKVQRIDYDSASGSYSFVRTNDNGSVSLKTTARPSVINGQTCLEILGEVGSDGWNGPSVELPAIGVTPADVHTLTVQYLYNNEKMVGQTMTLYFKIDGVWRHVTSADTIVKTPGVDMAAVRFDVKSALGSDYRQLRNMPITNWRLYYYKLDHYKDEHGYSEHYPLYQSTKITFGKMLLTGVKSGFSMVVR